jgi:hypothetical protein
MVVQAADEFFNAVQAAYVAPEEAPLLDVTLVNWARNLTLSAYADPSLLFTEDEFHSAPPHAPTLLHR